MPGLSEATLAMGQHNPDVEALRILSLNQVVTFFKYTRYVLPLDGYVFWLRTTSLCVQGSLHYTTEKDQREDETIAINRIIFTVDHEIQDFNDINSETIYIGESGGIKFAFSSRQAYYQAADLHHYLGNAVYPALESQLLNDMTSIDDRSLIVSNSLPAWLTLKNYNPVWLPVVNPGITLYPSFAVPDNIAPPYGAIHIIPEETQALSSAPWLYQSLSDITAKRNTTRHSQFVTDHVRVTLYGLSNDQAMDFLDLINSFTLGTDAFGLMNSPTVRDEKRTQVELGVLAQKKTLDYKISYWQYRMNDLAQTLISHAGAALQSGTGSNIVYVPVKLVPR